jgi:hypothetical protein
MKKTGKIGIQHYVPQFLLRNFCPSGSSQCFAFDKTNNRVFKPNVRNVAGEHGFYDLEISGVTLTWDPALRELEDAAAPLVGRIVEAENPACLDSDDRTTLSMFCAAQLLRCPHTRLRHADLWESIGRELRARGIDTAEGAGVVSLSGYEAKALSLQGFANLREIAEELNSKDWILFRAQPGSHFMVSDNPVVRQNLRRKGEVGIASPDVEVYLPLSSKLTLVFLCRNLSDRCHDTIRRYQRRLAVDPSIAGFDVTPVEALLSAITLGEPMECDKENVINVNSLQVKYSERFVFSPVDDFELVRAMIKSGRYRHGPRVTLS